MICHDAEIKPVETDKAVEGSGEAAIRRKSVVLPTVLKARHTCALWPCVMCDVWNCYAEGPWTLDPLWNLAPKPARGNPLPPNLQIIQPFGVSQRFWIAVCCEQQTQTLQVSNISFRSNWAGFNHFVQSFSDMLFQTIAETSETPSKKYSLLTVKRSSNLRSRSRSPWLSTEAKIYSFIYVDSRCIAQGIL